MHPFAKVNSFSHFMSADALLGSFAFANISWQSILWFMHMVLRD